MRTKSNCVVCGVALGSSRIQATCESCSILAVPDKIPTQIKSKGISNIPTPNYSVATPNFQIGQAPPPTLEIDLNEHQVVLDTLKEIRESIDDVNRINEEIRKQKKKEEEKPTLKLFNVLVTLPQEVGFATLKIKMTILDTDETAVVKEVIRILEDDGYSELSTPLVDVTEICGPFESGFVISRSGG